MKFTLIVAVALLTIQFAKADTFTVTNNLDDGAGSLREAIILSNSNAGHDKISFNIPAGDVASRTINLLSELPEITDPTIIDATTQPLGNAFGISYARIHLTSQSGIFNHAFSIAADSSEIYGFFIRNFKAGVTVTGAYAKIGAIQKGNVIYQCGIAGISIQFTDHAALQGNLIGVDTTGNVAAGATQNGIQIINSYLVSIGGKTLLANNIISGNNYGIQLQNATFVDVNSNYIGTNPPGLIAAPNQYGIYCSGVNNNIEIGGDSLFERNLISGNVNAGIYGVLSNSFIQGNVIGLNLLGTALGNGTQGIYLTIGSSDNKIGGEFLQSNTISNNGAEGIAFQNALCLRNTISKNSLYCNSTQTGSGGIKLNNANDNLAAPQLTIVTGDGLSGTATPNGTVELFYDDSCSFCEGSIYLATVTANANGVFSYSGAITGFVTATVTDADGNTSAFSTCADTSTAACMVAGFSTSGFLCMNGTINFVDQTVTEPATEVNAWSWSFGDGSTSEEASPAHTFTTAGTFNVQLISTNSSGCIDTVVKSVVINELPVADFNAFPQYCINSLVHFDDASTAGAGGTITLRNWDFGDGGTSTAVNPTHIYTTVGIKEVKLMVTTNFGCIDEKAAFIVIVPKPNADFTFEANNLTTTFTNTTDFNGAHSSSWDFDDGTTSIEDNPVHTFASSGTYLVCLTVFDSLCENQSFFCDQVDVVTGINDPFASAGINVYPNPAKDYLMVDGGNIQIQQVKLTTLSGAQVMTVKIPVQQITTFRLPAQLASGMYLLYLETDKGTVARKVVVE
jgi:PKD repeat protein